MHSLLEVTTPAADLVLLTPAQCRQAVGLAADDASQDAELAALEQRVAAAIVTECQVAVGSGRAPTLRLERLTETFRRVAGCELLLARRHVASVISLTEDGAALGNGTEFCVDAEAGVVTRLCNDQPRAWCAAKIVAVYDAGFASDGIPGDLAQAAMDFLRLSWAERNRDPSLKSLVVDIPDVRRIEQAYWVGAVPGQASEGGVPDIVSGRLLRFRNASVG